jgi:hypothetical protein
VCFICWPFIINKKAVGAYHTKPHYGLFILAIRVYNLILMSGEGPHTLSGVATECSLTKPGAAYIRDNALKKMGITLTKKK